MFSFFFPNDFHGHFESIRQILTKDHDCSKGIKKHAKHLQTSFLPPQEIFLAGRQHILFVFPDYILTNCTPKTVPSYCVFFKNCGGSTPQNNKKHLITVLYRHLSDVFCLLNKCRVTVVGCGKKHLATWIFLEARFFLMDLECFVIGSCSKFSVQRANG